MMRALRVQIVASLLAGLLTAGAAFSPVAAFALSSVGLSRRSPMRPAGACAMTRAEIPPNVAELMEKAKSRIDQTSVAVAGQKEVWNGERLPLPGFDLASFGLAGRWEEEEGSFFLEPPRGVEARGIVHFLGGAFVGAAPHISYRAMLEAIADEGYAIVATPYALQFDYIDLCQGVVARSAGALRAMQERYPALPVFGLGHSCGSLLHTILASAFDELPPLRAHALLSFNNKPAAESIPQFEELVAPFSAALMDPGQQAADARRGVEQALRDAQAQARRLAGSALAPKAVEAELIPLAEQSFKVLEQFPDLLQMVADGTREFEPAPEEANALVGGRFLSSGGVLAVQFTDDTIDESPKLVETLARRAAGGSEQDAGCGQVKLLELAGSHVTPITQDLFPSTPFDSFDPLLPLRRLARQELLRDVSAVSDAVARFFDEQLAEGRAES